MEFFGQKILWLWILAHEYYSNDDVLAYGHSDSDILDTVEKAEFLDDESSTLAGSEGNFNK